MIQPRERENLPFVVDIFPMQKHHLPEVYAIEVSVYPRPWPYKCFVDELTINKLARYTVALQGAKVVGYAGMWLVTDEGHITNIAVSYGYRRRKIAEQLLIDMIDHCINNGAVTMFLEVRRYNLGAQLLYTRYGFEPVQVRERYYADNDEDAIVLRIADMTTPAFKQMLKHNRAELCSALSCARPCDDGY